MSLSRLIVFLLLIAVFVGCEKEEKPIVLPPKDDSAQFMSANMGEYYTTQVYVNIKTGQTWSADNNSWDLQFASSANGYLVTMNGGRGILIGSAGCNYIHNLTGVSTLMRWDNSSGMKDSIVLGGWYNTSTWKSNDSVYVIDRGTKVRAEERFYQFQIKSVDANCYVLTTANMDGSNMKDVTVTKNPDKLNVYYVFGSKAKQLDFEPSINDWHLCFLRYRWIYYEFTPPLLYTVCGVNINTARVEAAVDSSMQFNGIRKMDAINLTYRDVRDVIGFDWKIPDFSKPGNVSYITRKYVNYFVREKANPEEIYKMHFMGFYDKSGIKGSPQFEVAELYN